MRIKAAVVRGHKLERPYARTRPLAIEEIDLAPPGPGEVLVQVKAAGLCHSDLSVINGDRPRPLPMVLGHEAAGIVTEVGAGVDDLAPGDHVVMVFMPSCQKCPRCREGRPALCEPGAAANGQGILDTGAIRLSDENGPIYHHLGVSAFAEFAVVSRHSLVRVDPELPFVEAALFGCAVLTGVGAVANSAAIEPESTVVILGLGGIGLSCVLGARMRGAAAIIAVDILEDKLALARDLGATGTVNAADPDRVEQVRELTGGGADYVFEMAGSAGALRDGWEMTRRGGMTVTGGLPAPGAALDINIVRLVAEERILKGSYLGSAVAWRDIPNYVELYRQGRLPVDRLLSGRLRLDDVNEGFDRLAAGAAVRQVIEF